MSERAGPKYQFSIRWPLIKNRKETLFSEELQKLKTHRQARRYQLKIVCRYGDLTLAKTCSRVCRPPRLLAAGHSVSLISFTGMTILSRYNLCKKAAWSAVSSVWAKSLVTSANKLLTASWLRGLTR